MMVTGFAMIAEQPTKADGPPPAITTAPAPDIGAAAFAFGDNTQGALGTGAIGTEDDAGWVSSDGTAPAYFRQISSRDAFNAAVGPDGRVYMWGTRENSTFPENTAFSAWSHPTDAIQVAAGNNFFLALAADHTVWAWGDQSYAQLGGGYASDSMPSTTLQIDGLTDVVSIAAGNSWAMALTADGTVKAWGRNDFAQTGKHVDASDDVVTTPRVVPLGRTDIVAIAAGYSFGMALTSAGTVLTWGSVDGSALGGTPATGPEPSRYHYPGEVPGLTLVKAIHTATETAYAIRTNGTVVAWGSGGYGDLGDGHLAERATPGIIPGLSNVTLLAVGAHHAVALNDNREVVSWGKPGPARGDGGSTSTGAPHVVTVLPTDAVPVGLAAGDGTTHVLIRPALLRAVTSPPVPSRISVDGQVADEWGLQWLKLTPGEHTLTFGPVVGYDAPAPVSLNLEPGVTTTVTGQFDQRGYLDVVTNPPTGGAIYVDGIPRNDWGLSLDIAPGTHTICFGPVAGLTAPNCETALVVAGQTKHVEGHYTPGGLTNTGMLAGGWGRNHLGQAGVLSHASDVLVPTAVQAATPGAGEIDSFSAPNFTALAAGGNKTYGLRPDGRVAQWGGFTDHDTNDAAYPFVGPSGVTRIAAAENQIAFLLSDGNVVLRSGFTSFATTSMHTTGIVSISVSAGHLLMVKNDGTLYGYGERQHGEAGDPMTLSNTVASIPVPTLAVRAQACERHSWVFGSNGTVYAFGQVNRIGIGNNDFAPDGEYIPRPEPVPELFGAVQIACGNDAHVALMGDGTVKAWGRNSISLGTTGAGSTPQLMGLSGVAKVALTNDATTAFALKTSGFVEAWGENSHGLLGNGSPAQVITSANRITGLAKVVDIVAGFDHVGVLAAPERLDVTTNDAVNTLISMDGVARSRWGMHLAQSFPGPHSISATDDVLTHRRTSGDIEALESTGMGRDVQFGFMAILNLRVITSPAVPATIYFDGVPRNDWGVWTRGLVGPGNHEVCFGAVPGFTRPACQTVNAPPGNPVTVTGIYS